MQRTVAQLPDKARVCHSLIRLSTTTHQRYVCHNPKAGRTSLDSQSNALLVLYWALTCLAGPHQDWWKTVERLESTGRRCSGFEGFDLRSPLYCSRGRKTRIEFISHGICQSSAQAGIFQRSQNSVVHTAIPTRLLWNNCLQVSVSVLRPSDIAAWRAFTRSDNLSKSPGPHRCAPTFERGRT